MEPQQYIVHLGRASEALADAADAAGPAAAVPTCDGWTVADLVSHMVLGDIWARTIVERGTTERVLPETPDDLPEGAALVPYFRAGARQLVAVLTATEPTTSVW